MIPMSNNEAVFWQSRMSVAGKPARFPHLTDLRELARAVRMGDGFGRPAARRLPAAEVAQSSRGEGEGL